MMPRWLSYALFAVWVVALATTPLWASNYIVRLAITIAMFTALTLSWRLRADAWNCLKRSGRSCRTLAIRSISTSCGT